MSLDQISQEINKINKRERRRLDVGKLHFHQKRNNKFQLSKIKQKSKMNKRMKMMRRWKEFVSNTSFHSCSHFGKGSGIRRVCWMVFALTCNAILMAAVMYLIREFENSPTKISSAVGKS